MHTWTYSTIGGERRVVIQSIEDIRHLAELDPKEWTVLGCPTRGLEIPDEVLSLMDYDHDGYIRVPEVVHTAEMLCATLPHPERMLSDDMSAVEAEIADIDSRIAATKVELQAVPAAPFEPAVMAAHAEHKDAFDGYFTSLSLEKLGLAKADAEAAPAIAEKAWREMSDKIAAYEADKARIEGENAAAIAAATAELKQQRNLLLLERWFYTLLRNYINFSDFYSKRGAIFQNGRLIIDQRECELCVRIGDGAPMATEAGKSGMYLIICHCENKAQAKQMDIIAAMTAGDVSHLFEGKNGIFFDRNGLDYNARITKIIDNPISLRQAFFAPYRKFAKWVNELVGKSVNDKESAAFEDMKTNASDATNKAEEKQSFDIARFAGIFAAIGMAIGAIGTALVAIFGGLASLLWWQILIAIAGLILAISLPSVIGAAIKMHHRDLSPILNANGWAVNAESIVSIHFGLQLTKRV